MLSSIARFSLWARSFFLFSIEFGVVGKPFLRASSEPDLAPPDFPDLLRLAGDFDDFPPARPRAFLLPGNCILKPYAIFENVQILTIF